MGKFRRGESGEDSGGDAGGAVERPAPSDPELAVLFAPDGATSCTVDGVVYPVVDGFVEVPHAAVASLRAHGYTD